MEEAPQAPPCGSEEGDALAVEASALRA
jgi:hypothetical protein